MRVSLIVFTLSVVISAEGRAASLEQSLASEYRQGTILTIQSGGVIGTNSSCTLRAVATFKDGQLHAPGVMQKSIISAAKCDLRPIVVGSQVNVVSVVAILKSSKIDFTFLQCDPVDCSAPDSAYKAQVSFNFAKGYLDSARFDEVQQAIQRVFAKDASSEQAAAPPATPEPAPVLASAYVNSQNSADRLQLNSNGSFSLVEGGQAFSGKYSVNASILKLQITELNRTVDIVIRGTELLVNDSEIWSPVVERTNR